MEFTQWLALLAICALGAMSPGPSLAVVVSSTLAQGRSGGLQAALAHGLGVALYGLLTVAGLAILITQSPPLFTGLQIGGALYLMYLGGKSLWQAIAARGPRRAAEQRTGAASQGFLVAFLNPKLAVFMLALFSQFLQPDFGLPEKALMVATVGMTDALWYCLVVMTVSHRRFTTTLQRGSRVIDGVFGVILVLLAITVMANAVSIGRG